MQAQSIIRSVLLAAGLLAIWWILSGIFDLLHFGTGAVTAVVLTLGYAGVRDGMRLRPGRLLLFLPWLLLQIIISNLRVARLVFRRRMDIRPTFISQPPGVRGERALTILAAGTTLTPGTLTVDVGPDDFFVHALDAKSAHDVREQVMAERVAQLFVPEER
jgi:multicomponent Na+:H+ antiporter subunit E